MKKKILGLVCTLACVVFIASCGSSSTNANLENQINASTSALSDLFDYVGNNCPQIWDNDPPQTCDCPNGGTVSTSFDGDGNVVVTFDNCTDASGNVFAGTATITDDGATFAMTQFADCSTVRGTVTGFDEGVCSGGITITCPAGTDSCTMSSDCSECDI